MSSFFYFWRKTNRRYTYTQALEQLLIIKRPLCWLEHVTSTYLPHIPCQLWFPSFPRIILKDEDGMQNNGRKKFLITLRKYIVGEKLSPIGPSHHVCIQVVLNLWLITFDYIWNYNGLQKSCLWHALEATTAAPSSWSRDYILGIWQLAHVYYSCSMPQSHNHIWIIFCCFLAKNNGKNVHWMKLVYTHNHAVCLTIMATCLLTILRRFLKSSPVTWCWLRTTVTYNWKSSPNCDHKSRTTHIT